MLLKAGYFDGRFEKIAQSLIGSTESSYSRSRDSSGLKDSSGIGYNNNSYGHNPKIKLQSTLSKAREKADVQPLHKDTTVTHTPKDRMNSIKMYNKQDTLSQIEDKRITFHHLRGK